MKKIIPCIILLLVVNGCKSPEEIKPSVETKIVSTQEVNSTELEIILSFISGDVFSGKKLSTGDKLPKGSTISTSSQSLADIQPIYLGLNVSSRLKENSEMSISERKNNQDELMILLKKGEAAFNTDTIKENQKVTVITPIISATLKSNTKFSLHVSKEGDTKLEIYEGKADIRLLAKEEYEKFPMDLNENISLKAFIAKDLESISSELSKGDKLSVTKKQRDEFLKKKRK